MDIKSLGTEIDSFWDKNQRNIIDDIAKLVAIRSVKGSPAPGAPYGEASAKALEAALGMAEGLGLETGHCDHHVGWGELKGKSPQHIATITHLDIVPEGDGWDGDPLVLREKDGWIIGRGVCDNKGPSVMCLYAAKFFKDAGIPLNYSIRVLLGTDEECGMQDLDYYLARYAGPLFAFSPDSAFPVCNGEKGIYSGSFVSKKLEGIIQDFSGGIAGNVIPDKAYCVIKADISKLEKTERVTPIPMENGLVKLQATGIGGHASTPIGTVNAIGQIVEYLNKNQLCSGDEAEFLTLMQKLHSATDGSGLDIACSDDRFDPLTCIGGIISFENGCLRQQIDIRYPTAITGDKITETLKKHAQNHGGDFTDIKNSNPFYISADSPAIQALTDTYNEIMGTNEKPFTMGGGTYARHMNNAVSFGPEVMGQKTPDFVGSPHGANEGMSIESMRKAMKIFILSLARLQQVDFGL